MKLKGLKSIAAVAAVSAGVLLAGASQADASTKITVQSGDTLSQLAQTYGVSVDSLQKANNIKDINRIYVGEVFVVGDNGNVKVASATSEAAKTATPAQPVAAQANDNEQAAAKPATQASQPASQSQAVQAQAPVAQATPAAQPAAQTSQAAAQPATSNNNAAVENDGSLDSIAAVESGGSYTARNGQYIGKYQLSSSYLNGDYSPANQERVARQYAISRYGSVANAVAYRNSHNYW
ncbi:LysM peptidoglycan-binding domain-containing protein [Fructilactobacillus carniphilus]|uniref:LysM peptidoglycan-binding domain-containing protein n=1 Tax=Fructilactobacillus carniphilus TaxID=2940297 RepID=A0ABY5BZ17_9LACO|nr:LysM peptidoglycan-binding domain-containing protein [Fructilactobacillus carniphilus]USS90618.1 LysM peptidoglycan-binding domain-containing protein [Fructilactobacillus carniphilus]